MFIIRLFVSILLCCSFGQLTCSGVEEKDSNIALIARYPTPVYSVKDIPELYYNSAGEPELKLDKLGHLRELEYIALPETKFVLLGETFSGGVRVYRVRTLDYPAKNDIYIDARFVRRVAASSPERKRLMPEKSDILAAMLAMVGQPYRWGGNFYQGIAEIAEFYPTGTVELSQNQFAAWILTGVDCSGLLYQAAEGATPRNTSQLVEFGEAVAIAGCDVKDICSRVRPLDVIVWKGHVLYVVDKERVIESRPRYNDGEKGGVRVHSLAKVLTDIMKNRLPVDDYYAENVTDKKRFVIRRFL